MNALYVLMKMSTVKIWNIDTMRELGDEFTEEVFQMESVSKQTLLSGVQCENYLDFFNTIEIILGSALFFIIIK